MNIVNVLIILNAKVLGPIAIIYGAVKIKRYARLKKNYML
jgi:hypothetical protein